MSSLPLPARDRSVWSALAAAARSCGCAAPSVRAGSHVLMASSRGGRRRLVASAATAPRAPGARRAGARRARSRCGHASTFPFAPLPALAPATLQAASECPAHGAPPEPRRHRYAYRVPYRVPNFFTIARMGNAPVFGPGRGRCGELPRPVAHPEDPTESRLRSPAQPLPRQISTLTRRFAY